MKSLLKNRNKTETVKTAPVVDVNDHSEDESTEEEEESTEEGEDGETEEEAAAREEAEAEAEAEAAAVAEAKANARAAADAKKLAAANAKKGGVVKSKADPKGAEMVEPEPRAPQRLKATRYDIKCPYTGVHVSTEGTSHKVPISNWLQAQIEAELITVVE